MWQWFLSDHTCITHLSCFLNLQGICLYLISWVIILVCWSCFSVLSLNVCVSFFLLMEFFFWLWTYIFSIVFHFQCQEFLYINSNVTLNGNIKTHSLFTCLFLKRVWSLLAFSLTNCKLGSTLFIKGSLC